MVCFRVGAPKCLVTRCCCNNRKRISSTHKNLLLIGKSILLLLATICLLANNSLFHCCKRKLGRYFNFQFSFLYLKMLKYFIFIFFFRNFFSFLWFFFVIFFCSTVSAASEIFYAWPFFCARFLRGMVGGFFTILFSEAERSEFLLHVRFLAV